MYGDAIYIIRDCLTGSTIYRDERRASKAQPSPSCRLRLPPGWIVTILVLPDNAQVDLSFVMTGEPQFVRYTYPLTG